MDTAGGGCVVFFFKPMAYYTKTKSRPYFILPPTNSANTLFILIFKYSLRENLNCFKL